MKVQPVILCGGSGTRLWPLSREQHPKQLLALAGDLSLLQATARRLTPELGWDEAEVGAPIVVGNEDYRFVLAEQLRQVKTKPDAVILEPCGRNTAPALTLAALHARHNGADPVLVVMPSDHVIGDVAAFRNAVRRGLAHAAAGRIVLFGVEPTSSHTGYGYIRTSAKMGDGIARVAQFAEKPDAQTAERYVASGDHVWNSGMFMMKASVWLSEIAAASPGIARACEAAYTQGRVDHDFIRVDRDSFESCPPDSIDYAVMERMSEGASAGPGGVVVKLDAAWSDVGAWDALWEIAAKDDSGNAVQGDVQLVDTRDSYVLADHRLVACVGLRDTIVVETADAVLVGDRARLQAVKDVVLHLKKQRRPESEIHRKIYRPWGSYDCIEKGPRFQVKRILVNPGASLSLQMHHHRAEHWIVVTGTARVTRGEDVFLVAENESTYIPLGVKHRLENPGKAPLEIIEIQSGGYLGEDDIVRFEDTYGRQ